MDRILLLKYGELCLKGKNRQYFTNKAIENLASAINDFNVKINQHFDYVTIEGIDSKSMGKIKAIVRFIPGFAFFCEAYVVEKNLDVICHTLVKILPSTSFSFKVEAKRSDKKFPFNSDEIKRQVGSFILSNLNHTVVDVHHPQIKINIEIKQDVAIFYMKKQKARNGLPIGSSGNVLMLLSGGIDSPVASYQLMSRGFHVDFLTFITPPHTSDKVLEKVKCLVSQITLHSRIQNNTKLYVCDFSKIQQELNHILKETYKITLLRRSFLRIASKLKKHFNYDALATGEALGQVASQTIESMNCISNATFDLILRPLICFNKEDIIDLAKEIHTYDISTLPYDDACSLFAPANPVTKPNVVTCLFLENQLDLLHGLEHNAFQKIEIIKFARNK